VLSDVDKQRIFAPSYCPGHRRLQAYPQLLDRDTGSAAGSIVIYTKTRTKKRSASGVKAAYKATTEAFQYKRKQLKNTLTEQ